MLSIPCLTKANNMINSRLLIHTFFTSKRTMASGQLKAVQEVALKHWREQMIRSFSTDDGKGKENGIILSSWEQNLI